MVTKAKVREPVVSESIGDGGVPVRKSYKAGEVVQGQEAEYLLAIGLADPVKGSASAKVEE